MNCRLYKPALLLFLLCMPMQIVQAAPPSDRLKECLQQSEAQPDQAYADAQLWFKENKNRREARLCLAMAMFQRGDYAEAAPRFIKLAQTTKNKIETAEMYNKAGWAFARAGDDDSADEQFTDAIAADPDNAVNWIDRATISINNEQWWDALADLRQAIKRDDTNVDAYAYRASVWEKLGNLTNARSDAEAALARDPAHPLAIAVYERVQKEPVTPVSP